MKSIYLLLFFISLQPLVNSSGGIIKIYESKQYEDYIFYYGVDNQDTIVFIAQDDFIKSCNLPGKIRLINKSGLSTISDLVTQKGDSIGFTYSMPVLGGCPVSKIRVGSGQPGQKNTEDFYTYSSYPYLIENCSAFQNK